MTILAILNALTDFAKNDTYSGTTTSWLTENGSLAGSLRVLDNDGCLAKLYSVSDTAPNGCFTLPQKNDTFIVKYDGIDYTGTLKVNSDGTVGFNLSALVGKLDSLAAGETLDVAFYYTDSMLLILQDSAKVTVKITGVNDKPVATAELLQAIEDGVTVSGALDATDVDHGASLTYSLLGAAPAGFTLNANGSYVLDAGNAAWQHLAAGASATQVVTYKVIDEHGASSTNSVTVTVTGVNDTAVITGAATGAVTEDGPTDTVTGQLTVSDVDDGQETFVSAVLTGLYGSFAVGTDGNWTYTLDNGKAALADLDTGETLTETFTVNSADGTTKDVTVTILGANDGSVLAPTEHGPSANDFDDLTVVPTNTHATQQDDVLMGTPADDSIDGLNGFDVIVGLGGNDTILGSGGWDTLYGQAGDDTIIADWGNDKLYGGSGNDRLQGDINADLMNGGSGDDVLDAGDGLDGLIGDFGADRLTGGNGADQFIYNDLRDRGDTITDFTHGQDTIVLNAISVPTVDNAFVWGGTTATANGLWYSVEGGNALVMGDTDGNTGTVEFWITLEGVTSLSQTDFLL